MSAREKLLKQFRELVGVRLERINRRIVELEAGASLEAGRTVLRELHGLKGEARMMGFDDINVVVHEMEELVRSTERAEHALSAGSIDALLQAADAVLVLSGASSEPQQAPPEVGKLVRWLQSCTRTEVSGLAESAPVSPGVAQRAEPPVPAPAPSVAQKVDPPARKELPERDDREDVTPAWGSAPLGAVLAPSLVSRQAPLPTQPPVPPSSSAPRTPMVGRTVAVEPPRTQGSAASTASVTISRMPPATPEPPPARTGSVSGLRTGDRADGSVRIGVASLDRLTSAVTNLTQVSRRLELATARRLELARELSLLARAAEDLGPAGGMLAERLGRAKELAASLHREAKLLANEELRDLGYVADEVQRLRMLPLSVLFEPYPRMVRDMGRELGKEVELVVDGEDTRADRAVVEALRDPLLHLVRNALDHGLESRVDRVASGKHPRGRLTLGAARDGNRLVLRVEDDGVGLEPALLRRAAVRKGFLDEATAAALTDQAARELIFLSGFTSREVATDISGRGVGLDAVRSSLRALGGDVLVESTAGRGTRFELRVPVSLTVAPLLFVKVAEETLCLSAAHVSRAVKVEASQVKEVAGRSVLEVDGQPMPFAALGALLGLGPEQVADAGALVLVVRSQGATAALAVDQVLEESVQAILPLKGLLARFPHLTGATTLADGRLAMVLSAAHLIAGAQGAMGLRAQRPPTHARPPPAPRRRILVVDDSPLTRELIGSLLEAVGYDIVMATDGMEALDLLNVTKVDLVCSDLEMPRVDGLELTRRLKAHPTHKVLPVVILTTRGGEEDRQRGLAAGADGYITKGDLVRQDLVDVVGRLLG
ncbi:response regulator [Vitiosangium sp. GDMCC 1.1324]|uniref:hybrid sensor histidine kinase/response regulator n=1 Tax=Vitiosangium sp. (strain GDMCC 1.1324) TaxID=2138576 RepID=UPI000D33EC0E|nr:response regulator [Vitiosangium sp. GDMCC 1.1324]PTL78746.1 hybrid sensor histidine kinase/response regulator [Vitiosangium sp. GDMCC 1.1324]